jgi:RNA 2',3'-cyclic 3'-phosphodiesterase
MRMFVAVWPDDATRRRIEGLAMPTGPHVRLVDPGQWHVTLRFLGDVDNQVIPELSAALTAVAPVVAGRIACEVGPATGWFKRSRVLYLPVTGLDRLAHAVRTATVPVLPPAHGDEPPFVGHLTLARSRGRHPASTESTAPVPVPLSASFEVTHFDLVASELSPRGARYTSVRRIPLRQ